MLDDAGHLVGVVSRGLSTEEGTGPTYASWVVGALNRVVELSWPPGVYPKRVHLMDLDHRLLRIEGRGQVPRRRRDELRVPGLVRPLLTRALGVAAPRTQLHSTNRTVPKRRPGEPVSRVVGAFGVRPCTGPTAVAGGPRSNGSPPSRTSAQQHRCRV